MKKILPKPFLFIHMPRTAGTFLNQVFLRLDVLELRYYLGLDPFRQPGFLSRRAMDWVKKSFHWPRYGPFLFSQYHTKYYQVNPKLRTYPCVTTVRSPKQWYISYLTFFMHMSPFLAHSRKWYEKVRAEIQSNPVIQLFANQYLPTINFNAWQELFQTNIEAFIFFMKNVRLPALLKETYPFFDTHKVIELDYMTCFYVWSLSSNPAKVLMMEQDALREYFASGAYTREPDPLFVLRQEQLNTNIRELLVSEFNYQRDIVDFVLDHMPAINHSWSKKSKTILSQVDNNRFVQKEVQAEFFRYYQTLAS